MLHFQIAQGKIRDLQGAHGIFPQCEYANGNSADGQRPDRKGSDRYCSQRKRPQGQRADSG